MILIATGVLLFLGSITGWWGLRKIKTEFINYV